MASDWVDRVAENIQEQLRNKLRRWGKDSFLNQNYAISIARDIRSHAPSIDVDKVAEKIIKEVGETWDFEEGPVFVIQYDPVSREPLLTALREAVEEGGKDE